MGALAGSVDGAHGKVVSLALPQIGYGECSVMGGPYQVPAIVGGGSLVDVVACYWRAALRDGREPAEADGVAGDTHHTQHVGCCRSGCRNRTKLISLRAYKLNLDI